MKIWAHRGCSQRYPENTITSFSKACELFDRGLVGIELDIQLTQDGHMVVIHDETVDRTTDAEGYVKDYTLFDLKKLRIDPEGFSESIPTIEEVLDIIGDERFSRGFMLNIELKNGQFRYEGMEEMILKLVRERGIEKNIVFSSFYAASIERIKMLGTDAELAVLDNRVSDCLYKARGGCGATALHPYWRGMDIPKEAFSGYDVRAFLTGHLYPEKPTGTRLDLKTLEDEGITDLFLNEPEVYL